MTERSAQFLNEMERAIQACESFRLEYGQIPGLYINGASNVFGTWMIVVTHPFIFDNRQIPEYYLGIPVRTSDEELPEEFKTRDRDPRIDYPWAYQRYEKFVDGRAEEIRAKLGKPEMTGSEMLNALCPGGDFEAWIKQCQRWEEEGKIPHYKEGGG